jgi:hypothetical protein
VLLQQKPHLLPQAQKPLRQQNPHLLHRQQNPQPVQSQQ